MGIVGFSFVIGGLSNSVAIILRFIVNFPTKIEVFFFIISQLPESLYKVYIKTTNGGFNVNGVDTESMELRTTNGIIMVENSHSDSFLLKTSNGAIVLTNVEAVNIKGDSSNGRLTFTNLTAEVINAETSNGNVNITFEN